MDKLSDLAAQLSPHLRQPRWHGQGLYLTSTSWDGDAFSDVSTSTLLNLSSVFGTPAKILKVQLMINLRDSAAWGTTGLYIAFGPTSTNWYQAVAPSYGGDVECRSQLRVDCNEDGNIYYRINASGTGTMDIWIGVTDYYK